MVKKVGCRVLGACILLILGGASWNAFAGSKASEVITGNTASREVNSITGPGGEELWSNNCQRCHNMRSPSMYTPAQWNVIVHHMRVRANITGAEQRAISDFLKSASH